MKRLDSERSLPVKKISVALIPLLALGAVCERAEATPEVPREVRRSVRPDRQLRIQDYANYRPRAETVRVGQLRNIDARPRFSRIREDINLDFSSRNDEIRITSTMLRNHDSINIQAGGNSQTIKVGDLVTASELAAVMQVTSSEKQTLVVGEHGNAISGNFSLASLPASVRRNVGSLEIPENVSILADVARANKVNLSGDLVNNGTMYIYSSRENQRNGAFAAGQIENNVNANILTSGVLQNSDLPASSSPINLTLNAQDSIVNDGKIQASGDLELRGQNRIVNTSSASIISGGNTGLISSDVANKGTISGVNTTIASGSEVGPTDTVSPLTVDNSGGAISAEKTLKFSTAASSSNLILRGGTVSGTDIVFDAGSGLADVNVDKIEGLVTTNAGTSLVGSSGASALTIGSSSPHVSSFISGDAVYFNNTGDITIVSDIEATGDLWFVADGDITATNAVTKLTSGGRLLFGPSTTTSAFPSDTTNADGNVSSGTPIFQAGNSDDFLGSFGTGGPGDLNLSATTNLQLNAVDLYVLVPDGNIVFPGSSTINTSNFAIFNATGSIALGSINARAVLANSDLIEVNGAVYGAEGVTLQNDSVNDLTVLGAGSVRSDASIDVAGQSFNDVTVNGVKSWSGKNILFGASKADLKITADMTFISDQPVRFLSTEGSVQVADPGTGFSVELLGKSLSGKKSASFQIDTPSFIIDGTIEAQGSKSSINITSPENTGLTVATTGVGGTLVGNTINLTAADKTLDIAPNPGSLTANYSFVSDGLIKMNGLVDQVIVRQGVEILATSQSVGKGANLTITSPTILNNGQVTAGGAGGVLTLAAPSEFALTIASSSGGVLAATEKINFVSPFPLLIFSGNQELRSDNPVDITLPGFGALGIVSGTTLSVTDLSGIGSGRLNVDTPVVFNSGTIHVAGTEGVLNITGENGLLIDGGSTGGIFSASKAITLTASSGELSFGNSVFNTIGFNSDNAVKLVSISKSGAINIAESVNLQANDQFGAGGEGDFDLYGIKVNDFGQITGHNIRITTFRLDFGSLPGGTIDAGNLDGTVTVRSFTNKTLALDVQGQNSDYDWGLAVAGLGTITASSDIRFTANGERGFDGTTATGQYGLNFFEDLTLNSFGSVFVEALSCSSVNVASTKVVSSNAQITITAPTVLHHIPIKGEKVNTTAPADLTGFFCPFSPIFNMIVCGPIELGNSFVNPNGDIILQTSIVRPGQDVSVIAAGNVIAGKGFKTINLSSKFGDGGNLTIAAGSTITPDLGFGQVINDKNTNYTIGGPSTTGGSIQMDNVKVLTGSSATNGKGGNIGLYATSGTINQGNVSVSSISSVSKSGAGGDLIITSPGHVQVLKGTITGGATAGGAILAGSGQGTTTGATSLLNGVISGAGFAQPGTLLPDSSVFLAGKLSTASKLGNGGPISIFAGDSGIKVTAKISTAGLSTGPVAMKAQGLIDVNAINSADVSLQVIGDSSIVLNGSIGDGTGTIDLSINGTGSISQTKSGLVSGSMVKLGISGIGLIGNVTEDSPLSTSADTLEINHQNIGEIYVVNNKDTNLADSNFGGTTAVLESEGSLTVNNVTSSATIVLQNNDGLLNLVAGKSISTTEGLINLLSTNSKNGGVFLGNGSTVSALSTGIGSGDVLIQVGKATTNTNTTTPSNVVPNISGTGKILYGTNGIQANGPSNNVTAKNATVEFNTGKLPASAIVLDGNVTIVGDPPDTATLLFSEHDHSQKTNKPVANRGVFNYSSLGSESERAGGVGQLQRSSPLNQFSSSGASSTYLLENQKPDLTLVAGNILNGLNRDQEFSNELNSPQKNLISQVNLISTDDAQLERTGGPVSFLDYQQCNVPMTELLVPSLQECTSKINNTIVSVAKGAAVYVVHSDNSTALICLHDSAKGDVKIKIGGRQINLRTGQHLVISRDTAFGVAEPHLLPHVAVRNTVEHKLEQGYKAKVAEFSIISALNSIEPLRRLQHSKTSHHRNVFNRILKNAAILESLTASHGPYNWPEETAVTAMRADRR